jgi:hypothetical protein
VQLGGVAVVWVGRLDTPVQGTELAEVAVAALAAATPETVPQTQAVPFQRKA